MRRRPDKPNPKETNLSTNQNSYEKIFDYVCGNLADRPDYPPPLRWRKTLAMRYKA